MDASLARYVHGKVHWLSSPSAVLLSNARAPRKLALYRGLRLLPHIAGPLPYTSMSSDAAGTKVMMEHLKEDDGDGKDVAK